jgi:hypothetical protein
MDSRLSSFSVVLFAVWKTTDSCIRKMSVGTNTESGVVFCNGQRFTETGVIDESTFVF